MYWTFVGVSSAFILPAIFFLLSAINKKATKIKSEHDEEIAFLKNQLSQIISEVFALTPTK